MAKTAQEKALEDLGVAERKLKRATEKRDAAKAAIITLEAEVASLTESRDYLKQHPALKSLDEALAEAQAGTPEDAPADSQEAFAGF